MKQNAHTYALKLETAFRVGNSFIRADEFEVDFSSALEAAVGYFRGHGIITEFEAKGLLDCCEWGTRLGDILEADDGKDQIEALIRRVSDSKANHKLS